MIASIAFRHFKALRNAQVALAPFNVIVGPNGSGKTSLIESVLRLRTLASLPVARADATARKAGHEKPEIVFHFAPPHAGLVARVSCRSETTCDLLQIEPVASGEWPAVQADLKTIRGYVLDHAVISRSAPQSVGAELGSDGAGLAAVLADLRARHADAFSGLTEELLRIMPEFRSLELVEHATGGVEFGLRLVEDGLVPAAELSQGILYLLAVLALAFNPAPPRILCLEEVDRGLHPRLLREIRDALYRLSYPQAFGSPRPPVQVVTTTHSPYFIDLFRDHPEEVIISHKRGRAAHFARLADRPDLPELLREGSLGDMWFSGILGGVPDE